MVVTPFGIAPLQVCPNFPLLLKRQPPQAYDERVKLPALTYSPSGFALGTVFHFTAGGNV
jgi:hypothetical protein